MSPSSSVLGAAVLVIAVALWAFPSHADAPREPSTTRARPSSSVRHLIEHSPVPLATAGLAIMPLGTLYVAGGLGVGAAGLAGSALTPRWPNGAPRAFPGEPGDLAQARVLLAFSLLVVGPLVAVLGLGLLVVATALLGAAAAVRVFLPPVVDQRAVMERPSTETAPVPCPAPPPPAPVVADGDGDGVPDDGDRCPSEAGPAGEHGCPAASGDADHDGLADNIDRCPNEAGGPGNGGCPGGGAHSSETLDPRCMVPANLAVAIRGDQIEIPTKVQFAPETSTILGSSTNLLDQVALTLRCRTDIRKLRVEGFTDTTGSEAFNVKLSRDRATAVRDFLVNQGGVDPGRLDAVGRGAANPVASNDDDKGREANRRVEFVIVEVAR